MGADHVRANRAKREEGGWEGVPLGGGGGNNKETAGGLSDFSLRF